MIEIKNLSKSYTSKDNVVEALRDINITINQGEIYGIIGLSGAGKSSILRCINLLERPTSGEVLIKGRSITGLSKAELRNTRRNIGMIFQHFNLLMNSTVYDNIAFPLKIAKFPKDKIQSRVFELLDIVGLTDKKDAYPAMLSGGQKQRVGIARALASSPEILLCDEATSALDPTTTESILDLLHSINKSFGITIVVVTHEMDVIKHLCHRVAVVEGGLVVEEGNVIDIFSNPSSTTSKKFLKDTIAKLPHSLLSAQGDRILRVYFPGDSASKPYISHMVREFNVDANIISGTIENIQGNQVGNLIIKLTGEENKIQEAIEYLITSNLRVEVISNEDL